MTPKVKICCISSAAEARLALKHGAWALGLVSEMPSGPGVIAEDLIAEIAASAPESAATFLLTAKQSVDEIADQARRCGTNTVQIVDELLYGTHAELKRALPGVRVVQVIHVIGEDSIAEAQALSTNVDAILLDSGNQKLAVKELGGTGRTHDWALSKRIVESVGCPVFLAGGLRPENVGRAVREVRPYGLDLCSGVRTDGHLDEEKLERFFASINGNT
jgi:phosphoribosylanthranilate isomerase